MIGFGDEVARRIIPKIVIGITTKAVSGALDIESSPFYIASK